MRACRELGLATVAVYSDSDRLAPHVRYADDAVGLCADEPGESYLRVDKLLDAARRTGADTVHPGYGFLAENATFARRCEAAGLRFVGPSADIIALMGGKTAARRAAQEAGLPLVPGSAEPVNERLSDAEVAAVADEVGYPLFVKAVAGGGGKGMRVVAGPDELPRSVQAARSEADTAFGDPSVYFERRVSPARHVEIQVLADHDGRVVPFVERECSIQRRHQKVIEETPSVAVSSATRRALASAAKSLAERVGYTNAGTVEFLLDDADRFYFLEMNTRLQVEHPITEMVTGVDIVQWQLRIATGEPLSIDTNAALEPDGHAIECRVYAEDPELGFLPSPGRITHLRRPGGPGIRDDSGVDVGFEVPVFYDSMISKLVAWAPDRSQAIRRMARALAEYDVGGVKTTIPFFRWMLTHPDFVAGRFDTGFLDRALAERAPGPLVDTPSEMEEWAMLAAAVRTFMGRRQESVSGDMHGGTSAWRRAARLEGLR